MAGNGTRPKKALRAIQIITLESLPSDHNSASLFRRAKASRKMKMLCASRSSSRSTCITPNSDAGDRLRRSRAVGSRAGPPKIRQEHNSLRVDYLRIASFQASGSTRRKIILHHLFSTYLSEKSFSLI